MPESLSSFAPSRMANLAKISFIPPVACATMSTPSTDPKCTSSPATASNALPASNMLTFLHLLQNLKTTKRTGWLQHGIRDPESISDHMYRMALLTFTLPHNNRDKLLKLCLAHDLAECIVGDITPRDGVSKSEKYKREEAAMSHIRDDVLLGTPGGCELYDLWKEYEDGVTEEAKIVKQFDKMEMIVQAGEYERDHGMRLDDFFHCTEGVFKDGALVKLDQLVRAERVENSE